jgi:putative addiction module CopG family antidote
MDAIQITLTEDMWSFVEKQVASGGFATPEVYVRSLLESERRRKAMAELEVLLLEGVESPVSEMTQADWDEIRRKGYEHLRTPSKS